MKDIPGERSMAQLKVEIKAIGGISLTVVVKSVDRSVWQRNPFDCLTIAIIAIFIFVDIVTQMQDIIHRILSRWITE